MQLPGSWYAASRQLLPGSCLNSPRVLEDSRAACSTAAVLHLLAVKRPTCTFCVSICCGELIERDEGVCGAWGVGGEGRGHYTQGL